MRSNNEGKGGTGKEGPRKGSGVEHASTLREGDVSKGDRWGWG